MFITFEERLSDSPFVDRIWRSHSERDGSFISLAMNNWEIVVSRVRGSASLLVRGPETRATRVPCPADGEWLGIRFKPGTFMPHLPPKNLVDGTLTLPEAAGTSFWLKGSAWQQPDFENADTFVDRLVRQGLVVREPVITATLEGQLTEASLRSAQRRFLGTLGLTHNAARQIERARYAATLLQEGVSILDTIDRAGYYDQPHLTRSLKHYIGQTPAQLVAQNRSEQLSFLYKTQPFC